MLESLLDLYGHHMDNDWNNLVTRGFDEAQEKVGDGCLFPADILEHNAIIMLVTDPFNGLLFREYPGKPVPER